MTGPTRVVVCTGIGMGIKGTLAFGGVSIPEFQSLGLLCTSMVKPSLMGRDLLGMVTIRWWLVAATPVFMGRGVSLEASSPTAGEEAAEVVEEGGH